MIRSIFVRWRAQGAQPEFLKLLPPHLIREQLFSSATRHS